MPSTSVPASQPTSSLVRSGALEHQKTIARILEVNALSFAYPSDRFLMFKHSGRGYLRIMRHPTALDSLDQARVLW